MPSVALLPLSLFSCAVQEFMIENLVFSGRWHTEVPFFPTCISNQALLIRGLTCSPFCLCTISFSTIGKETDLIRKTWEKSQSIMCSGRGYLWALPF